MTTASLYTLPIELIYYIFKNLDTSTILFSFRNVCKRFYSIVNNYNQYELDLSSISKTEFHRVCCIIHPNNIISLTLSDGDMTPGQIGLFMSVFNINQFIRLRSLKIMEIEKSELNQLIENININSLNALSIKIRKNNSKSADTSMSILLSNLIMANLRKLDLSMWNHDINNFIWPKNDTLQSLTLGHYVTLKQVYNILGQLSYLRTFVVRNCIVNDTDGPMIALLDIPINTHLTSLTFNNSRLQMNELTLLLSLTPSLVHLQLTGSVSSSDPILDGLRWEEFIQNKLPLLEKFEFFFRAKIDQNNNPINIESWIVPFKTIFWLQHKSWLVTCNYIMKTSTLRLYSIPICDPCITYESDFDKIECTNYTTMDNDISIMNNVREVHLDLPLMMTTVTTQKMTPRTHHLFYKLTDLTLTISGKWSVDSIEFLSTLVDLSHLTTLGLYVDFHYCSMANIINNIRYLLQQTYNVRSLTLSNSFYGGNLNMAVSDLCQIVPHHIKHLDVYDMDLNDIKILITRLKFLSSITFVFVFDMSFSPNEIIEWLSERIDFTYLVDNCSFSLWLGKDINVSPESILTPTTSKLTDHIVDCIQPS